MFRTILIITILILSSFNVVVSECRNCTILSSSKVIGIKQSKEFVNPKRFKIVAKEQLAIKKGYSHYSTCKEGFKKASGTCSPAYLIKNTRNYLCPRELKAFKNKKVAKKRKYLSFIGCQNSLIPTIPPNTPTPSITATPAVTPRPLNYTFQFEDGNRFSNVDAISIGKLQNSNYRMYYTKGGSSLDNETLRVADSVNGLDFVEVSKITGIEPDLSASFTNPAFYQTDLGKTILLYVSTKHISSGGIDIQKVLRATSNDGINFVNEPDFVALPGGSSLASSFQLSIISSNSNNILVYYSVFQDIKFASSSDNCLSYSEPQQVTILGRGEHYVPYIGDTSVLRTTTGKYLLFLSAIYDSSQQNNSIFLAESDDGITFYIFDQPLLTATSDKSFIDPTPLLLSDNKIRLYYIERNGIFPNIVRNVKSINIQ